MYIQSAHSPAHSSYHSPSTKVPTPGQPEASSYQEPDGVDLSEDAREKLAGACDGGDMSAAHDCSKGAQSQEHSAYKAPQKYQSDQKYVDPQKDSLYGDASKYAGKSDIQISTPKKWVGLLDGLDPGQKALYHTATKTNPVGKAVHLLLKTINLQYNLSKDDYIPPKHDATIGARK